MKRLLVVSLFASLLVPEVPEAENKTFKVYMLGNKSCGSLLDAYESTSSDKALRKGGNFLYPKSFLYESWIAGYVSAANVASNDVTTRIDMEGVTRWVRNYCEENPADRVINAAAHFVREKAN